MSRRIFSRLLGAFLLLVTYGRVKAQQMSVAPMPYITVQLLLPGQEVSGKAADGVGVYFSKDFDNEVGYEDSYKFTNPDENIAILRNGSLLSIEGRKLVGLADTLPLKVWKLCQPKYLLKVDVANLSGFNVYLHDAYLHKDTELYNNTASTVSFAVNVNEASVADDRFSIILRGKNSFTTLPVDLTRVNAYEKNKGVEVTWTAENENNIDRYVVEQSSNGRVFEAAGMVKSNIKHSILNTYSWYDANANNGDRFYRIKSIEKSGEVKYSAVVKVQIANAVRHISASTTSGQANSITLFFKNAPKGNYKLTLVNPTGQAVYAGNISYQGGASTQVLNINTYLAAGVYRLVVFTAVSTENIALMIH